MEPLHPGWALYIISKAHEILDPSQATWMGRCTNYFGLTAKYSSYTRVNNLGGTSGWHEWSLWVDDGHYLLKE